MSSEAERLTQKRKITVKKYSENKIHTINSRTKEVQMIFMSYG